jgi:hypothetical protein
MIEMKVKRPAVARNRELDSIKAHDWVPMARTL